MNRTRIVLAIIVVFLAAVSARALDNIKTVSGVTVSGKIVQIGWEKVEIEQGIGDNKTIKEVPANQIVTIFFDSGSPVLKKAILERKKRDRRQAAVCRGA